MHLKAGTYKLKIQDFASLFGLATSAGHVELDLSCTPDPDPITIHIGDQHVSGQVQSLSWTMYTFEVQESAVVTATTCFDETDFDTVLELFEVITFHARRYSDK